MATEAMSGEKRSNGTFPLCENLLRGQLIGFGRHQRPHCQVTNHPNQSPRRQFSSLSSNGFSWGWHRWDRKSRQTRILSSTSRLASTIIQFNISSVPSPSLLSFSGRQSRSRREIFPINRKSSQRWHKHQRLQSSHRTTSRRIEQEFVSF